MEEKQDFIVNVGIKQSQKDTIVSLIEKKDRYKSINEFAQEAVSKLIESEYKKETTGKENKINQIINDIIKINVTLLTDELLENHKLTEHIINYIENVKTALAEYQRHYMWYSSIQDKTNFLLQTREFKTVLDQYISILENENKLYKLGIPESIVIQLKNSRVQLLYYSTQEVQG